MPYLLSKNSNPTPSCEPREGVCVSNVSIARGGRIVIENLSLSLVEKRIALVGLNGSGKSTLVRALNGLISPIKGKVCIHGVDAVKSPKAAARMVGFVFQNPDHQIIFPTVAEDIAFGLRQAGISKSTTRAQAKALLREYDCEEWADRPISELSEGQKHLVCILSVLIMEPEVLVLDEPFSSLDIAVRTNLLSRLKHLRQQIILINHDLDVFDSFDRMIWLKDGRVEADGLPESITPLYRKHAMEVAGRLTPESL
ncbi:ABC transporter ATP-binding protein [Rhizobiales bacterium]|uniref:energy-coupling factor ABC transporter ATP-binding protein n=1 Tax=Hongsoonwoonella zoysiae TaxID=2821844 RepID=UPI00156000D0|nr:ABC transporter ATP-binding protein [Hongsoonwoonella zoysiae]NRG17196.1 ABC transporter ATP-binding protein [Hongsoonwoonella zoysiae]